MLRKLRARDQDSVGRMEEVLKKGTVHGVSREPDRRSSPSFTELRVKEDGLFKLEWYEHG